MPNMFVFYAKVYESASFHLSNLKELLFLSFLFSSPRELWFAPLFDWLVKKRGLLINFIMLTLAAMCCDET